jgi:membrane protease YdiL (CAAX protease family)
MNGAAGVDLVAGARVGLMFGALSVLLAVVRFGRQRSSAPGSSVVGPRRKRVSVATLALTQAVVVLTLAVYYRAGAWTLESVGVSSRVPPLLAFLAGVGEFGLFTLLTQSAFAFAGSPFAYLQAATRANVLFSAHGRVRRLAIAAIAMLINPIAEELMFRGLLVHQLVVVGAPLTLSLTLGALINATNHAYQGRFAVLFHLVFYGASVFLVFSPIGLVGAIGFHFAADVLPVVQYRTQLRAYRTARRALRSNSGLQRARSSAAEYQERPGAPRS